MSWVSDYLDGLPVQLRPDPRNRRFMTAAAAAEHHGWTPAEAVTAVAGHSYRGKTNPPVIAIMELERVSERPPRRYTPATGSPILLSTHTNRRLNAHSYRPDNYLDNSVCMCGLPAANQVHGTT